jgi:membrane-bound lytic murein transglycosylase D
MPDPSKSPDSADLNGQKSLEENENAESNPTGAGEFAEPSENVDPKDQKSLPVESVVSEDNTESSDSNHKIKNETRIAENSLSGEKIQPVLDEALDFCQAAQDFWQKGELENALEALDHAYALILGIETDDSAKLIQQKEDLRFMIAKRILEIYASRNIVINGNYKAIPLVMNKHVQNEIVRFTQNSEKKFFIESYKRSGKYRSQIVSALKEAGLPVELSWLPLIESGFKVNALSKARALGMWQFIPSTGYKFGLNRDKFIDERIDPVKSTQAAIAYLKELHQIFGDWSTVLAAYNCGEGKVLRVIRTQNINYLDNFWDLYERLPLETARYVPRFIATLYIIQNKEKYGLDSISLDTPLEFETVTISKQVHLKNVATEIDIPLKTLVELNPELRYQILPQDQYPLRVPPGKGDLLLAELEKIPVSYPPQRAYVYHRIRPGESLSTIARRYHTSVNRIKRANNLYRSNLIVAGKTLKIPRRGTVVYPSKTYTQTQHGVPSSHVVRSGDSLWIIAKRYDTTTKKIQELNNLSTTRLHIGQVLKIPGYKSEKAATENLKIYRVKHGDTPFQIAQLYKMPLERFLNINRLTPKSNIFPGQKLFVE